MRGDQLAQQWRIFRAIEVSYNGLTVAEIAQREETGIRLIYQGLEAIKAAVFPLYIERVERANRWFFWTPSFSRSPHLLPTANSYISIPTRASFVKP